MREVLLKLVRMALRDGYLSDDLLTLITETLKIIEGSENEIPS